MKKLILLVALLFATNAQASVFIAPDISADAAATAVGDTFDGLADIINGNIEGSSNGTSVVNIKADSVYEINMADDANPRVRDSELFNITVDTISGGAVASQGSVIESGCVPATAVGTTTSDVSACTAYINGYRVVKSATSQTYTNNTTTYLWLSQTGVYTQSTNPDSTIANSALLAKVVTSGGSITTVTTLFTSRVPGLIIPANYRTGLQVSRDSATTITVFGGSAEINNTMLSKSSTTTLTISTAGDWAGGSSLRAADTYGFVGMDSSGNLKLHTTAPTNTDYSLTGTSGKKRYASWSSTTYRVLGWFYMDGSQNVQLASNIKEFDVANSVVSGDSSAVTVTSSSNFVVARLPFYSSGNQVALTFGYNFSESSNSDQMFSSISMDGVGFPNDRHNRISNAGDFQTSMHSWLANPSQSTHTFTGLVRMVDSANAFTIDNRSYTLSEQ